MKRSIRVIALSSLILGISGCVPDDGTRDALVSIGPLLAEAEIPLAQVRYNNGEGSDHTLTFIEGDVAETNEPAHFAYRSITKSFVGTVVLQLVDEGKLSLDDPVSEYISGVPDGDQITIAQLGTMRSELPNYSALPSFGEELQQDPARTVPAQELLELAFSAPTVFPPGSSYEYSNTNTVLLGEIIESVEGVPWQESVARRIVDPIGLDSVSYPQGAVMPDPETQGFQIEGGIAEELPPVSFSWFGAAGGLVGDIESLDLWARALGAGDLVSQQSHEYRLGSLASTKSDSESPFYDAYGFALGEIQGWIGHTGTGLGYQSLAMYNPKSGDSIAILLNATGSDPDLPARLFTGFGCEKP